MIDNLSGFISAVQTWLAPIGRPVFFMRAQGTPVPYAVLNVTDATGVPPEVVTLGDSVAASVGLIVTSIGYAADDALWLDGEIYERLLADPPSGLPVSIGHVYAPTSATLVSSEGTLVHAEHRYGISYR